MPNIDKTLEDVKASFPEYSDSELASWKEHLEKHRSISIHDEVLKLIDAEIARRAQ